jgi:hypothetical protein
MAHLPMQRWRATGPSTGMTTPDIHEVLDMLADLIDNTSAHNGTESRGTSESAWEVDRTQEASGDTVAVVFKPNAAQTDVAHMRVIVAGYSSGSPTPKMAGNHTTLANNLLIGTMIDVGGSPTWQGWDHAEPYAGCFFLGYRRFYTNTPGNIINIDAFEGREALAFALRLSTSSQMSASIQGCIWEAPSHDPADCRDADGRVYGGCAPGTAVLGNTFHSTSNAWPGSIGSANNAAVDFVKPDTTAGFGNRYGELRGNGITVDSQRATSGKFVAWPLMHKITSTQTTDGVAPIAVLGRMREIMLISNRQHFDHIDDHNLLVLAASQNTQQNALGFVAAA